MTAVGIIDGLHMVTHRGANMYLLTHGDRLVLIDTGFPDSATAVLDALREMKRDPTDVSDILLTHGHFDHIGSAAELAQATGAQIWCHEADRDIVEGRAAFRPTQPAPGLLRHLLFRIFSKPGRRAAPCPVDRTMSDSELLPLAGGLRVIHVPGHCAGQAALLWETKGVLFTADACMNILGLGDPVAFEDEALGHESQRRLAALDFSVACFGHGKPVMQGASQRFRAKWC